MTYSVLKAIRLQAVNSNAPVRSMVFNALTPLTQLYGKTRVTTLATTHKTTHGDEICYIFYCKFRAKQYSEIKKKKNDDGPYQNAYRTIETMKKVISSFAKTGDRERDSSRFPPIKKIQFGRDAILGNQSKWL